MSTPTITELDLDDFVQIKDADCNATAEKDIFAGPCRVTAIRIANPSAAIAYVKLYNDKNPTVGTTAPAFVLEVPVMAANVAEEQPCNPPDGWLFSEGLSIACVTTAGTAGTTSPATNPVLVTITGKRGLV